jgi:hypothetical protein
VERALTKSMIWLLLTAGVCSGLYALKLWLKTRKQNDIVKSAVTQEQQEKIGDIVLDSNLTNSLLQNKGRYYVTPELVQALMPYLLNDKDFFREWASGTATDKQASDLALKLMQALCTKNENRYFSINLKDGYIERE